jgi:2-iminobutanoate/2-iminopropanoate deaminase
VPKKAIRTPNAPQPPANFSHAVVANGMVYCAGVSGRDPKTGQVVSADLADQVDRAMQNLSAILIAAGSSMDKVVHTTCYVLQADDIPALTPAYMKYFPADPPARASLVIQDFGIKGMKFEIVAVATL